MGSDRSKSAYRAIGLLFPLAPDADPTTRLLASGSYSGEVTYSQANPLPGVPEPSTSNVGRLVLEVTGELSGALSADQEVRIQKGGLPWPGGSARQVWRYSGDTNWRGWDVPTLLSEWEAIEWTDGSGSNLVRETRDPHAMGLPNGKLAVVYQDRYQIVTSSYRVRCAVRSVSGTWSAVTIYEQSTAPGDGFYPCLWRVPAEDEATGGTSGALYCAFWAEDTTVVNSETANIRVYRSDDDGATWTLAQKRALADDIAIDSSATGFDPHRIRAAYQNGQTMMVLSLHCHDTTAGRTRDIFKQVASADEGFYFATVALWDRMLTGASLQGGKYHELLILNGRFTLIYVTLNSSVSTDRPVYRQTAEAFEDLRNDAESAIDGAGTSNPWGDSDTAAGVRFLDGDLAAAVDWDGVVYVYGREVNIGASTTQEGVCFRSTDYGQTWAYLGQSSARVGCWWYGRDALSYPTRFSVAPQGGRMALVHNWEADVGNEDDSLGVMYLGGWSTVTMPDYSGAPLDTRRVGWEFTWLPFELPADIGGYVTSTRAGVYTDTLDSAGFEHIVATVGSVQNLVSPTSTPVQGLIVLLELRVPSGGSLAADNVGAELVVVSGGNGYDLSLRAATNGFEIFDNLAAAIVGAAATVAMTSFVQILLAFSGAGAGGGATDGRLSTWYRTSSTASDRSWTRLHNAATLTSGAVAGGNAVRWGVGLDGNVTATADFKIVCVSSSSYTGRQLSGGQTNPDDLFPGPLSALPYPTDAGVRVFARSGPGAVGDTWTASTDYEYPIRNLLPEVAPSPRRVWRSTDLTEQKIAIELSSLGDQRTPRDILVCALFGVRQRVHYLEGRSASGGAWTLLATLNAAQGADALPFTRSGHAMEPDTATAGSQYPFLHEEDYRGGYARLDTNIIRPIRGQSSGVWQTASKSGTYTRAVITLGSVEGGDPSSGQCQLWSPQVVAVVHLAGARYNAYRIRVPNQEAPNSYFEIGTWFLGYAHVLAQQYAWGRGWEYEDGTEAEEMEDGQVQIYEAAPGRRVIDLPWESIDTEFLWSSDPDPDYVVGTTTSGGRAVGTPQATASDLEGIWRRAGGQRDVVLYLPYLPQGPSDAVILTSRQDAILARFTGPPSFRNHLGDEHSGEVLRASLGLREEV